MSSTVLLYWLLGLTCLRAAAVARCEGHNRLAGCYYANAVFYGALSVAHVLHLDVLSSLPAWARIVAFLSAFA